LLDILLMLLIVKCFFLDKLNMAVRVLCHSPTSTIVDKILNIN
jgi:hypothetical protein